jgi:predicted RNase H-like nuclease
LILIDQPTIVVNPSGQRPVEHIVSSAVSLRFGGMQPASTSRVDMFGQFAPIWPFLARFGGPANPVAPAGPTLVFETYPVLAIIALGWALPDARPAGRLPKYNPARKETFTISDWQHVCGKARAEFRNRGLQHFVEWLEDAAANPAPRKRDQDRLDAVLCLLVPSAWRKAATVLWREIYKVDTSSSPTALNSLPSCEFAVRRQTARQANGCAPSSCLERLPSKVGGANW